MCLSCNSQCPLLYLLISQSFIPYVYSIFNSYYLLHAKHHHPCGLFFLSLGFLNTFDLTGLITYWLLAKSVIDGSATFWPEHWCCPFRCSIDIHGHFLPCACVYSYPVNLLPEPHSCFMNSLCGEDSI